MIASAPSGISDSTPDRLTLLHLAPHPDDEVMGGPAIMLELQAGGHRIVNVAWSSSMKEWASATVGGWHGPAEPWRPRTVSAYGVTLLEAWTADSRWWSTMGCFGFGDHGELVWR